MYLIFPEDSSMMGYADHIWVAVVAKHLEDVKLYSCETVGVVEVYLKTAQLYLAEEKMQLVLIT